MFAPLFQRKVCGNRTIRFIYTCYWIRDCLGSLVQSLERCFSVINIKHIKYNIRLSSVHIQFKMLLALPPLSIKNRSYRWLPFDQREKGEEVEVNNIKDNIIVLLFLWLFYYVLSLDVTWSPHKEITSYFFWTISKYLSPSLFFPLQFPLQFAFQCTNGWWTGEREGREYGEPKVRVTTARRGRSPCCRSFEKIWILGFFKNFSQMNNHKDSWHISQNFEKSYNFQSMSLLHIINLVMPNLSLSPFLKFPKILKKFLIFKVYCPYILWPNLLSVSLYLLRFPK